MARFTQKERESSAVSTASSSTGSLIVVQPSSLSATPSTRPTSITSSSNAANADGGSDDTLSKPQSTRLSSVQIATVHPSSGRGTPSERMTSRAVSGQTLVNGHENEMTRRLLEGLSDKLGESSRTAKGNTEDNGANRRSGRLSLAANALATTASSLGKRGRETMENGKSKLRKLKKGDKRKSLRPRGDDGTAMGSGKTQESPRKTTRLSTTTEKEQQESAVIKASKPVKLKPKPKKKWLSAGLYVGQHQNFDARLTESKNKVKQKTKNDPAITKERKILPLPMFIGARLLEVGRDFKLPFDIFSPLPPGQPKPDEWRKTQSNRFTADAASEWKEHKPLPLSRCLCTPESGCDEDCQNRYMLYECDSTNCNIGPDYCTNRQFAQLKERVKSGKKYNIGVEVLKTVDKGFGVRACRTFNSNQIIVEYAGEVITQEECDRRMKNEYKDAEAYYLMNFDQNMIIDATRGSIARFVNHSCEPNCNMVKWIVSGKPRMALFAGDKGIMTGEELTYDYCQTENFLWGKECRCGAPSCRGVVGADPAKDTGPKTQKSTKAVTGVKRKFQSIFEGAGENQRQKSSPVKKKPRITQVAVPLARSTSKTQKRLTSNSTGHTTLIETADAASIKEGKQKNLSRRVPGKGAIATSTSRNAKTAKRTINRVTSGIKRKANALGARSVLKSRGVSQSGLKRVSSGAVEKVLLDKGKENSTMSLKVNEDGGKASGRKAAMSTFKKGVVSTVTGPRRAAAAAKMGLRGGDGMGKSMRIISQEHAE